MIEHERYTLSLLREELRATGEEAERLVRALDRLEMLAPLLPRHGAAMPAAGPSVRPAKPTVIGRRKGREE